MNSYNDAIEDALAELNAVHSRTDSTDDKKAENNWAASSDEEFYARFVREFGFDPR